MSFNSLLINSCTIQTRSVTQDTTSGQEIESWSNTLTSVRCRIDPKGAERHEVPAVIWQKATNVLFLFNPLTLTLSVKTHRIAIGGINYEIVWIPQYQGSAQIHHLELLLEQKDNG